jgi:putative hemolysin
VIETLLWILLFSLILLSAYFSASETSLFSLSSMQIKAYGQSGDRRRILVSQLLKRPADLLVTLLVLNTIANILIQNVVSSLFGEYSGWLLNVGVPLAITLIFGEVIPKSIGVVNKEVIATNVATSVSFFERLFSPIRFVFTKITQWITPWEFFFLHKQKQISVEELRHALKTSYAEGVLNQDEAELVRGYLQLKDASVKELLRPRDEVLFYDLDEPLEKLVHLFVDEQCSRIPICKQGLDEVVGIMSATSYFLHANRIKTQNDLLAYVEKPFFVPEVLPALSLLRKFYDKKQSLALAIDEYSSVSGLVTLEDLVESVIGEIIDRREKQSYTRSGKDVIIASGKLELSELEEILGVSLESPSHMVTIGGWLTEQMGDIPKSGTKFESHGLLFHVLASDPNRIRRVYIRRLNP